MRKILLTILTMFMTLSVYAADYVSPMSMYQDNYFIAGNQTDQVKLKLSAKFAAFYPAETGIFLGYTQLSLWKCYQKSDTFYTNYMPEVFYRLDSKNNLWDLDLKAIDFIQFSPIQHASTGVEGINHRSINIYYGQIQMSTGDLVNIGFNVKGFGYYTISKKNADINDYRRNYEADVFFKIKSGSNWYVDKYELHAKCTGDPRDKGYYQIEAQGQVITDKFQPKIFVQYQKGYSDSLVFYNKKSEKEIRAGFIF